ncbi:hypothetical protein P364_0110520 [Paenibacillus sp. MAEPY2]|nr:hypothetical protein P363_0126305 [Paenibacillus sp. MAEPY1]KGP82808.1 hypothetical protein P364_0110520 [Paenibacillus sp. MAEPY2]
MSFSIKVITMKVSSELKKIDELLDTCAQELKIAGLEPSTEINVYLHANHFVCWCNGDFVLRATLRGGSEKHLSYCFNNIRSK